MSRRVFRCADARAVARGGLRVFAKKQGNTGDQFVASIERQRAQIATIAKTLGIQPTR
jgi:hypothetical protein